MAAEELAPIFAQDGFSVRFEWGPAGARALAPSVNVLVIVDVLSFTTAVEVAVARGARVYPYRYRDDSAAAFAKRVRATLAVDRRRVSVEEPYSLSPASLAGIPAETSLVLPSPNGSAISTLAAEFGRPILAGCLRNAAAVARAARALGEAIGVIALASAGVTAVCDRHMKTSSARVRSWTVCRRVHGRPRRGQRAAHSALPATICKQT